MNKQAAYELGVKLAFEQAGFEKEAFIRYLRELAKRRAAQAAKMRVAKVRNIQKGLSHQRGWRPNVVHGVY